MKLVADLHLHTVSSGHAYSTLEEYIARAREIGLEAIGITDHGPAMPGAPHQYHFSNLGMIPRTVKGIRVYRGVEANVINEQGEIDFKEDRFTDLDIVMVAMHPLCGYENHGEEENTQVLLKALGNPLINVIAHPGNPKYPVNIESVVSAAKEKGVIIEINNSSFVYSRKGSWERCLQFAREVKRQDWKVIIGSDSHISTMLGKFDRALELVEKAGLSEENVVNTSLQKIDQCLSMRSSKQS